MVKKGTKKDAFYPKESYWRHDASSSTLAVADGTWTAAALVDAFSENGKNRDDCVLADAAAVEPATCR
ncbi:hypothetical protein D3C78_1604140 [compost metagenome]